MKPKKYIKKHRIKMKIKSVVTVSFYFVILYI